MRRFAKHRSLCVPVHHMTRPQRDNETTMSHAVYNVLFLGTHNSARSIMAEVFLNECGHGRFKAYSAGVLPTGAVDPLAIEFLQSNGRTTTDLRSKHVNEFASADAPVMDLVISVCDDALGEPQPEWPAHTVSAHWGVPDPTRVQGDHAARHHAFVAAGSALHRRIELLVALPLASLDRLSLHSHLADVHSQA